MSNTPYKFIIGGLTAVAATITLWFTEITNTVKGPEPGSEQWNVYKEEQYKNLRSDILDLKFQLTQSLDWQTNVNTKFALDSVRKVCAETAAEYNKYQPAPPAGKRLNAEDCYR